MTADCVPILFVHLCNEFGLGSELFVTGKLLVLIVIDKFFKDLLIELILNNFSLKDGVWRKEQLWLDDFINFFNLGRFLIIGSFLSFFLNGWSLSLIEYGIDCEEHLPKDALDEGGDDIDNGDVAKAEEEHDVNVVIGCSPAVVKSYHWPASLSKHLHHHVHSLPKSCEIAHLNILIIGRTSPSCIEIVEDFHGKDDVDVEEEGEKVHELKDDGHDLQDNGEDILDLVPNLKIYAFHEVAVRHKS